MSIPYGVTQGDSGRTAQCIESDGWGLFDDGAEANSILLSSR